MDTWATWQLQRQTDQIDRCVGIHHAALGGRALVCGGRELTLGQSVDAVVLDDIGHVYTAPQGMHELPHPDRGRIAVARYAQVDQ
jgi:hypothetical protein